MKSSFTKYSGGSFITEKTKWYNFFNSKYEEMQKRFSNLAYQNSNHLDLKFLELSKPEQQPEPDPERQPKIEPEQYPEPDSEPQPEP